MVVNGCIRGCPRHKFHSLRGGEVVSRLAHNQEIVCAIQTPATNLMQNNEIPKSGEILHQNPAYLFFQFKASNLLFLLLKLGISSAVEADDYGYVNRVKGINAYILHQDLQVLLNGWHHEPSNADKYRRNDLASLRYHGSFNKHSLKKKI